MNEKENIQFIISNNYNLKTNTIKGPNGEIVEPSVYLDSDIPMNKVSESPELTKDQLEKMKETLATEINKTTKAVSYDDLIEVAVREQAKEEIRRRILSGEVKYDFAIGHEKTPEQVAFQVLDNLESTRREYLQSVAQSKGNVR